MTFPNDENFEEDSGTFMPDERPTDNVARRRRKRELAQDPDYRNGRMVRAIIDLRSDVDDLLRERITLPPPPRPSLKPQIQTAGISATVSAVIMGIYQLLHMIGVLK